MRSFYEKLIDFMTIFASDYIAKVSNAVVIIFTGFDITAHLLYLNITIMLRRRFDLCEDFSTFCFFFKFIQQKEDFTRV